ncbi:MAG: dUTP diphosphatase [Bacteroidota bacterium]|nr:dUTP diphosphatase [Bacteroidota bacterium]
MLNVLVVNKSANPLPAYQTVAAAGLDLMANIESPIELNSLERKLIPTGLFIELPVGHEAQIRPRSGLALKKGITVLNTPGTIDADYRGEIQVLIINLSPEKVTLTPGERIAQMIVSKHETITWQPVEELNETQRGNGGYGSTGI